MIRRMAASTPMTASGQPRSSSDEVAPGGAVVAMQLSGMQIG
jgi:hypothetical protein